MENPVVAKDGARRLVQWSATVLRDAQGAVEFVACTGHDITDQRLAEQRQARLLRRLEGVNRLQEELIVPASLEEKFKKITDAAVELIELDFCRIWMVRPGDLCNAGCIHAAGSEEGRLCRRDKCLHLIASSGRYTHTDGGHRRVPLGAFKIGRIAADVEKKFLTNSVTTDPNVADHAWAAGLGLVSFAGYRLHDARGNTTGVLASFAKHPITEESDAFLANLADMTSKVIVDHNANEELRQSQKLEGVGQLAGGIAHEFNNLLQVIGGYTRCAMEGLPPEEQRDGDLAQVVKAADRAAALTRQLLGFSRRSTIQPKSTDANLVVRDLAKLVQPLIGEHIALNLALEDNAGTVYRRRRGTPAGPAQPVPQRPRRHADADRRRRRRHAGAQDRTRHARRALWDPQFRRWPPGPYVVFSVSDTGCGIARDVQPHIFEPFFTTKEVGKGSGLGLSMVHGIVQQHKGAIHVYSEPGMGSTFRLYLPPGDDRAAEQRREEPRPVPLGKETILVAEDDPTVRKITTRTLQDAGYTVLAACDGEEAVEMFQENRGSIALVLLDVIMPRMTGHEAHRRLKELAPETKVVFCTGYDRETAQCDGLLADDIPLVQKPFTAERLLSVVREVLDAPAACPAT